MMQRGGQVVINLLANVKQQTIEPLIKDTIMPGTLVYTDEYSIYARLDVWSCPCRVRIMVHTVARGSHARTVWPLHPRAKPRGWGRDAVCCLSPRAQHDPVRWQGAACWRCKDSSTCP